MPDGTKVQRDLYSAFLIQNVNDSLKQIDTERCNQSYNSFLFLHDKEIQRLTLLVTPSSMGIQHIA